VTDRIPRRLIRESHRVEIFRIPGCETGIASIRVFAKFLEDPANLVDRTPRSLRRPTPPELTVDLRKLAMSLREVSIFEDLGDEFLLRHRRHFSFFYLIIVDIVGIVIPDVDVIFYEEANIRVSAKKPEKFCNDSFPVDFLGREKWESLTELEAKLPSEKTLRDITTSEVFVIDAILEEVSTEIKILLFWMDRHRR
jgi:hypothetical protein